LSYTYAWLIPCEHKAIGNIMKQLLLTLVLLLLSLNTLTLSAETSPSVFIRPNDANTIRLKTAADFALHYYESKDYIQALKYANLSTQERDAKGQFILGILYYFGLGLTQDYIQAFKYFELAAEQGHAKAQYNLGLMYAKGEGLRSDYEKAIHYYRLAAGAGHTKAQCNLGCVYSEGKWVKQDNKEAFKYFKPAADQGDAYAQYNLGVMYKKGLGITQNYNDALYYFKSAANQGDEQAKSSYDQLNNDIHQAFNEKIKLFAVFISTIVLLSFLCAALALTMKYMFKVNVPLHKLMPVLKYIIGCCIILIAGVGGYLIIRQIFLGM
jgi:TPR repeat protein